MVSFGNPPFNAICIHLCFQVSTASALAGTTLTSVQTDTKSEGRFQDVTDNINESGEVEQKLNATKSRLTITSKPADLDLD